MNTKEYLYGLVQYQDGDFDEKEKEGSPWMNVGVLPKEEAEQNGNLTTP